MTHRTLPLGSGTHSPVELGLDAIWWDVEQLRLSWRRASKRVAHFEPYRVPLIPWRLAKLVQLVGAVVVAHRAGESTDAQLDALAEWLET